MTCREGWGIAAIMNTLPGTTCVSLKHAPADTHRGPVSSFKEIVQGNTLP